MAFFDFINRKAKPGEDPRNPSFGTQALMGMTPMLAKGFLGIGKMALGIVNNDQAKALAEYEAYKNDMDNSMQDANKGQIYGPLRKGGRPYILTNGGMAEPMAVQTEKGETIVNPNMDIFDVKAKKTHEQMKRNEITDILGPEDYVLSNKTKISKNKADKMVIGVKPLLYSEDGDASKYEEIKLSSLFKKKEHTMAELSKIVRSQYSTIDEPKNTFEKRASDDNRQSRANYLGLLMNINQKKVKIPIMRRGGFSSYIPRMFLGSNPGDKELTGTNLVYGLPNISGMINPYNKNIYLPISNERANISLLGAPSVTEPIPTVRNTFNGIKDRELTGTNLMFGLPSFSGGVVNPYNNNVYLRTSSEEPNMSLLDTAFTSRPTSTASVVINNNGKAGNIIKDENYDRLLNDYERIGKPDPRDYRKDRFNTVSAYGMSNFDNALGSTIGILSTLAQNSYQNTPKVSMPNLPREVDRSIYDYQSYMNNKALRTLSNAAFDNTSNYDLAMNNARQAFARTVDANSNLAANMGQANTGLESAYQQALAGVRTQQSSLDAQSMNEMRKSINDKLAQSAGFAINGLNQGSALRNKYLDTLQNLKLQRDMRNRQYYNNLLMMYAIKNGYVGSSLLNSEYPTFYNNGSEKQGEQ